jgi:hypothetical protein
MKRRGFFGAVAAALGLGALDRTRGPSNASMLTSEVLAPGECCYSTECMTYVMGDDGEWHLVIPADVESLPQYGWVQC